MKILYEKWWDNGNKVIQIINYKSAWKENGNKPRIKLYENGGRKSKGDSCFDINLIVGYTVFNYCNFNLNKGGGTDD